MHEFILRDFFRSWLKALSKIIGRSFDSDKDRLRLEETSAASDSMVTQKETVNNNQSKDKLDHGIHPANGVRTGRHMR